MYYEEKVIDGILCYRSSPDGKFEQFTLKELTIAYVAMKSSYEVERSKHESLMNTIKEVVNGGKIQG